MKKQIPYIIIALIYFTFPTHAQSPWTKKKSEIYTQFGGTIISSYNQIYGNPEYFTHRTITDNTFQLYGEYGVSDKTTLLLNIPYKYIKTGKLSNKTEFDPSATTAETVTAFGNVEMGVKHNFYNKKWIVTGQFSLELNTSNYYGSSGIRTGYDAFTFTPLINTGRNFKNFYIQAFTGFNIRTTNYSSNFKIGGELGSKISKRFWLMGFLDFVVSLNNGDFEVPLQNSLTALYVNNQEYYGFGIKTIGEITPKIGFIAGLGGAFHANNVAKEVAINFGMYYKINSD